LLLMVLLSEKGTQPGRMTEGGHVQVNARSV
jgi:hypothetical protein